MVETYFTFRNDFPQYYWLSNVALFAPGYFVVSVYEEFASYSSRLFTAVLLIGILTLLSKVPEVSVGMKRYFLHTIIYAI